ncbi:MAG: hypothetical protein CVU46_17470, partial [Chloroflexi bacterium HGW-Chloroflexi-8]
KEDIPELVGFFVKTKNGKMGVNVEDITPRAMQALLNYDWPGNIRELDHAIEFSMMFCDTGIIDLPQLPMHVTK